MREGECNCKLHEGRACVCLVSLMYPQDLEWSLPIVGAQQIEMNGMMDGWVDGWTECGDTSCDSEGTPWR